MLAYDSFKPLGRWYLASPGTGKVEPGVSRLPSNFRCELVKQSSLIPWTLPLRWQAASGLDYEKRPLH